MVRIHFTDGTHLDSAHVEIKDGAISLHDLQQAFSIEVITKIVEINAFVEERDFSDVKDNDDPFYMYKECGCHQDDEECTCEEDARN